MNYYRKNREILLQKAHDKYPYRGGKEKAKKKLRKQRKN